MYKRFCRQFPKNKREALNADRLFTEKLRDHVKKGTVFAVPRNGDMDFYYGGGKLFGHDGKSFRTNIAHIGAFHVGKLRAEVTEADVKQVRFDDFVAGYERIRQLCQLLANPEARAVSALCRNHGYASTGPIVVLDVEAAFDARAHGNRDRGSDRIDLVLLHCQTQKLLFIEAKLFSNSQIRSSEANPPEVVVQIQRYNGQVRAQRQEILAAYGEHVRILNDVFRTSLPEPTDVQPDVALLVFQFDGEEEQDVKKKIAPAIEKHGTRVVRIGRTQSASQQTLAKWWKHST